MTNKEVSFWKRLHFQESTIVDLHAHPALKASLFNRLLTSRFRASRSFDPFSVRTDFPKLQDGGVDVVLSTVYAPEKGIFDECTYLKIIRFLLPLTWSRVISKSYFDVTIRMLDRIEEIVAQSGKGEMGKPVAKMAYSVKELEDILGDGDDHPIAFVHNIEGAHSLDGNLDNLKKLFDRGVAYLTLAHFFKNELVHPCFPWPESVQKFNCFQKERDITLGLTEMGEQAVEMMVDMGMLIDVSHCTPPARARIYDIVGNKAPLIATHVGAYEINPSPYNLKDWEMERIADSGGVVGVIFMNYWLMPHETKRGLNFIARTIDHIVNTAGIDHVGIGTDFDGFTDPPDDIKDASELPRLTKRLVAEEYSEDAIVKIWGANALRVLREGWGKKE
jgi:microsomal dipeptidase-like Zn-dependent dipeptidase